MDEELYRKYSEWQKVTFMFSNFEAKTGEYILKEIVDQLSLKYNCEVFFPAVINESQEKIIMVSHK